MNNQEIVSKLWNLCNVLRDDGITYHQYVTELTYILFLKMAKETGAEDRFSQGITLIEGQKFTNGEKQVVVVAATISEFILGNLPIGFSN